MKIESNISGVYGIFNTISKKWYVGSSTKCIQSRYRSHKMMLANDNHHSRYLQYAWNKYGEDAFVLKVLEQCSPHSCIETEQRWIDKYNASSRSCGYNVCPNARNPLGVRRSEKTKNKMKKIARNRSPELLAKIKAATTTLEVLAKISKTHKGKVLSQYTRQKISESVLAAVPRYRYKLVGLNVGRKLTSDQRRKMSLAHLGRKFKQSQKDAIRKYALNRSEDHSRKIREAILETNRIKRDWKILDKILELTFELSK